ncbi:MAG: hypothetical protein DYG88_14005 [Chloroflexi bacterium CFX4]|nr:hypothetical protein [Chloroflexi bacterium CFX4]MDL1923883.1 hypothetical protein [Chloroflexi bacterium CFX3]
MTNKPLRTLSPAERLFFALAVIALLLLPLIAFLIVSNQGTPQITLTVYADQSLRDSVNNLVRDFEAAYPTLRVELRFMSAAEVVRQAERGVPIDVLILPTERRIPSLARQPDIAAQFVQFLEDRLP